MSSCVLRSGYDRGPRGEKRVCRLFINRDRTSEAKERDLKSFFRFPILDVRVLGAIAAAIIAID